MIPSGTRLKTAADRAAQAIEAAERMFAEEMGATLDLSPAAKMALIVKIAAPSRPLSPKRNKGVYETFAAECPTARVRAPLRAGAQLQPAPALFIAEFAVGSP